MFSRDARSRQHAARSTQHSAPSTQHAARSTQHAALSTQHARVAHDTAHFRKIAGGERRSKQGNHPTSSLSLLLFISVLLLTREEWLTLSLFLFLFHIFGLTSILPFFHPRRIPCPSHTSFESPFSTISVE